MENENKKRGRPYKVKSVYTPFAIRLRELGGDMTHQEIADGVGVSRQTIGQFMLGNTRPDIDTLSKLADFFNVSTDYLLCRTDIKSADTDLKGVCEYIQCSEDVVKAIRSIYTNCVEIFREGVTKDKSAEVTNSLNSFFSSPIFTELIQNIFFVERESKEICDIPISIMSSYGYSEFKASEIEENIKQCLNIPDLISKYVFRMIIIKSMQNNYDIVCDVKEQFKYNFEEIVESVNDVGLRCDVRRYKANKVLEDLLNELDHREKLSAFDTKEQWLNYFNITEQDLNDIIKNVKKAKEPKELLEMGAISKEEYDDIVKLNKGHDKA